jgi:tRNA-modifying protein YgfZ
MSLPDSFMVPVRRDVLWLTGRDHLSFLQGMVSNDVLSLTPGQGCYAFHLTSKGQVLADALITCLADALLLITEPGWGQVLTDSLEHHLVMERVKIATELDQKVFLLGGAIASSLGPEGTNIRSGGFYVQSALGVLALGGAAIPAGAIQITKDVLEGLRIEQGIPRGQMDFDATTLAPETGQAARAIHYKKGCYIGQEIVARIDARGHTNRGLVGFYTDGLATPGVSVTVNGSVVGRITSSAVGPRVGVPIALGYVRNEFGSPGTEVQIDGKLATVAKVPFVEEAR